MGNIYRLETTRVVMRQWRNEDYAKFASMNADSDVMRYFPSLLSREESDVLTTKLDNLIAEKGWGFWVAERKIDNAFIGLVGLNQVDDLPVASCVEAGWRLAKAYWGNRNRSSGAIFRIFNSKARSGGSLHHYREFSLAESHVETGDGGSRGEFSSS